MLYFVDMKKIRQIFPKSLFSRFLIIVITPTVLAQLLATYVFYYRHWDNVAKDISLLIVQEMDKSLKIVDEVVAWCGDYDKAIKIAKLETGFNLEFEKDAKLEKEARLSYKKVDTESALYKYNPLNVFDHLNRLKITIKKEFQVPFAIYSLPNKELAIRLQLKDGVFEYKIPRKRIIYSSTYIFVLWMLGIAIIVTIISVLFLRNQVRSIKSLTKVAEKFGKGIDVPDFKPKGAKEIRAAGLAFIKMRERIKKQVDQRTKMLAGVSHDLRTPLTRMRLQTEMMKDVKGVDYLKSDIEDMERMINEYLEFAKGQGGEKSKVTDIDNFIDKIVTSYKRTKANIDYVNKIKSNKKVTIKQNAIKRSLTNLIDNAFNHANKVLITLSSGGRKIYITIEDDGPGIPLEEEENIFRPFYRCDESRNLDNKAGVGLGLSIAKDAIVSNGGSIKLLKSEKLGGAKFEILIPFASL